MANTDQTEMITLVASKDSKHIGICRQWVYKDEQGGLPFARFIEDMSSKEGAPKSIDGYMQAYAGMFRDVLKTNECTKREWVSGLRLCWNNMMAYTQR